MVTKYHFSSLESDKFRKNWQKLFYDSFSLIKLRLFANKQQLLFLEGVSQKAIYLCNTSRVKPFYQEDCISHTKLEHNFLSLSKF